MTSDLEQRHREADAKEDYHEPPLAESELVEIWDAIKIILWFIVLFTALAYFAQWIGGLF